MSQYLVIGFIVGFLSACVYILYLYIKSGRSIDSLLKFKRKG